MKDFFIKEFMTFNKLILRLSRGRLGSKFGKQRILILHTTGRKSGEDRAIPIAYFKQDGQYLIVGSNWGREKHANWVLNLRKNPQAKVEITGREIPLTAHEAQGEEYQRLWKLVSEIYPPYLEYQKKTTRHIPIMMFEPIDE
ncbi:MAG: nitroreductase family deazaflavin-dependent oxidoreductase [Anaerolineaceae bacterium]|nr:nitroreductase family deazaflavin-dependent oxidoreductase [Anaerolineaceae bacterium]